MVEVKVELKGLAGQPAPNGLIGTIKGPSTAGADGGRVAILWQCFGAVEEVAGEAATDGKAKGGVCVGRSCACRVNNGLSPA